MPRNKGHLVSQSTTRLVAPMENEDGELLPCWRCGKNDGELVGKLTVAWVLDNAREYTGNGPLGGKGRKIWAIQQTVDAAGDPTPALREIVKNKQNYHRECDNIYTRKLRNSKNTRIKTLEEKFDRLQQFINELALQRAAQPLYTPPQPQPRGPRPPGRPPLPQYDPIYSRLAPLPAVDPSVSSRLMAASDVDMMEIIKRMEDGDRLAKEGKLTQAEADAINAAALAQALRDQEARDELRRQADTARRAKTSSEAEHDTAR